MALTTADLPIACTEGWSTVQRWTGVPLADLARLAGRRPIKVPPLLEAARMHGGSHPFGLPQVSTPDSMLALRVNGADLSLDHGFPARVIVPSAPGTHNVKWMSQIAFSEPG